MSRGRRLRRQPNRGVPVEIVGFHDGNPELREGVPVDPLTGALYVSPDTARSPIDDQLTATRTTLISLSSVYPLSALRNITSGTVEFTDSEYRVASGGVLESAELGRYVPGYPAEVGVAVRGSGDGRFGYFDDDDGIFFEISNGELRVVLRRDGVDAVDVARPDFNVDALDGDGPSRLSWDSTRGYVYQIRFTWYGYGQIEWRILRAEADRLQHVATVHRHRVNGGPSIRTPNLPIKVETTSGELFVGGRQFSILGGWRPTERVSAVLAESVTLSTSYQAVCSFRRKNSTDASNVSVRVQGYDIASGSDTVVAVLIGATLTGASWGAPELRSADETAVEVDTSATFADGEVVWNELVATQQGQGNRRALEDQALDIRVPRLEPVTLVARALSGTPTAHAVLRAGEEW